MLWHKDAIIYQGNGLWDFSLVDQDNQQPVDYDLRRQMLAELEQYTAVPRHVLAPRVRKILDSLAGGRAKLYLAWRLLHQRRSNPEIFQQGSYIPLDVTGAGADHLRAFACIAKGTTLVTVAPRRFVKLAPESGDLPLGMTVWGKTSIAVPRMVASAQGTNILTRESVEVVPANGMTTLPVAGLLTSFPAALLQF